MLIKSRTTRLTCVGVLGALVLALAPAGAASADISSVTDSNVTSSDVTSVLAGDPGVLSASSAVTTTSDSDSAAVSTVDGTTVDVPRDLADGVTMQAPGAPELSITPSAQGVDGSGVAVADGVTAFPSNDGSATAVQATDTGGVRLLRVIANSQASPNFTYNLDVPSGGNVSVLADGSAMVYNADGSAAAFIQTPWATDASGAAVPTYFTSDGTTLTQHVDLSSPNIVYPVTADPSAWSIAWRVAKCAAVVAASATVAYKLIKLYKTGLSLYEFATLLIQGTGTWQKVVSLAGAITGVSTIIDACKP